MSQDTQPDASPRLLSLGGEPYTVVLAASIAAEDGEEIMDAAHAQGLDPEELRALQAAVADYESTEHDPDTEGVVIRTVGDGAAAAESNAHAIARHVLDDMGRGWVVLRTMAIFRGTPESVPVSEPLTTWAEDTSNGDDFEAALDGLPLFDPDV